QVGLKVREGNGEATIQPVKSALVGSTPRKEPAASPAANGDSMPENSARDFCHTGNFGDDVWNCCACCCESGLFGGAEATFLAPLDEPKQRVVLQDLVTGQTHSCESDSGLGCGVRTWLGLQRCGWGFRATFWHFEADNVKTEPSVPIKSPTC